MGVEQDDCTIMTLFKLFHTIPHSLDPLPGLDPGDGLLAKCSDLDGRLDAELAVRFRRSLGLNGVANQNGCSSSCLTMKTLSTSIIPNHTSQDIQSTPFQSHLELLYEKDELAAQATDP